MNRIGRVTPDADAYSRVSNPERFQPLVDFVITRFAELIRTFDVTHSESFDVMQADQLQPFVPLRPPITLTPSSAKAAPLAVAFTRFPGVFMRCGYWRIEPFPHCGCDACQESAPDEIERFSRIVDAVVAGRFHETARKPFFGRALVSHEFWDDDGVGRSGGGRYLSRAHARESFRGRPRDLHWGAWPRRT
jgi:hypothetical protein